MLLEGQLEDLLDKHGVKIFYTDQLDGTALYVAKHNTVVVNTELSEFDTKLAILHELAHAMYHRDFYDLYKQVKKLHSKMEYEANTFMIDYMINEHDNKFNYSMMFEHFNFNMGMESQFQR